MFFTIDKFVTHRSEAQSLRQPECPLLVEWRETYNDCPVGTEELSQELPRNNLCVSTTTVEEVMTAEDTRLPRLEESDVSTGIS